jgi:phosphohistidine phosphatase
MELLLVRHAIAGDKTAWAKTGRPDADRPLTAHGRRKMKRAAKGLRSLVASIDLIAPSPLVRAVQTARVLADRFPRARYQEVAALSPGGGPAAFLAWLGRQRSDAVIAAVGHEPDLSQLCGWLLTGRARSLIEFKKGAVCLLRFDRTPAAGEARLIWSLAPAQLRSLAT